MTVKSILPPNLKRRLISGRLGEICLLPGSILRASSQDPGPAFRRAGHGRRAESGQVRPVRFTIRPQSRTMRATGQLMPNRTCDATKAHRARPAGPGLPPSGWRRTSLPLSGRMPATLASRRRQQQARAAEHAGEAGRRRAAGHGRPVVAPSRGAFHGNLRPRVNFKLARTSLASRA